MQKSSIKIDEYFKKYDYFKNGRTKNSEIWKPDSLLIHVYGAWGSGKSTFLNLLRNELNRKYLVIEFNAWQHQRIGPPWWSILDVVSSKSIETSSLSWYRKKWIWFIEKFQRKLVGPSRVILTLIVFLFAGMGIALLSRAINLESHKCF